VTTKLAHQTQKTAGIPNGMRTATIAAVSGSAITISVAGGQISSGVGVVTSYAPIVGDTVAVFRQDSSWLILGPTSAVNGWHAMSDLGYQNGWTDRGVGTFPIGQYRVVADTVQIAGELTIGTIPTGGQVIVSGMPAPTGEVAMIASMGSAGVKVRVSVLANGNLTIQDATAATFLQMSCSYQLDLRLS
jgi:hypothetical protein